MTETETVNIDMSRADLVAAAERLSLVVPRKASKQIIVNLINDAQRPITAPIVDLYGGPLDGHTWTKTGRGTWPWCLSGDDKQVLNPAEGVRMLAGTTTGIYLHVTENINENTYDGTPTLVHKYIHSSMITAYRVMNGPQ